MKNRTKALVACVVLGVSFAATAFAELQGGSQIAAACAHIHAGNPKAIAQCIIDGCTLLHTTETPPGSGNFVFDHAGYDACINNATGPTPVGTPA